jgi:hypothetical protein
MMDDAWEMYVHCTYTMTVEVRIETLLYKSGGDRYVIVAIQ